MENLTEQVEKLKQQNKYLKLQLKQLDPNRVIKEYYLEGEASLTRVTTTDRMQAILAKEIKSLKAKLNKIFVLSKSVPLRDRKEALEEIYNLTKEK